MNSWKASLRCVWKGHKASPVSDTAQSCRTWMPLSAKYHYAVVMTWCWQDAANYRMLPALQPDGKAEQSRFTISTISHPLALMVWCYIKMSYNNNEIFSSVLCYIELSWLCFTHQYCRYVHLCDLSCPWDTHSHSCDICEDILKAVMTADLYGWTDDQDVTRVWLGRLNCIWQWLDCSLGKSIAWSYHRHWAASLI